MKRLLVLTGILLILGLVGLQVFSFLTQSKITINISPELPPVSTSVFVDGKPVAPTGEGGQAYEATVGIGTHEIVVSSAGYSSARETLKTGYRGAFEVDLTLEKVTATKVAQDITSAFSNVEIREPKFFGKNNDWVVFYSVPKDGQLDRLLVIAKFDSDINDWEVVGEGTDVNTSDSLFNTAPAGLVDYVEESLR